MAVNAQSLKITYPSAGTALLVLNGDWTLDKAQLDWHVLQRDLESRDALREIRLESQALGEWDSRLLTLLQNLCDFVAEREISLDLSTLPDGATRLLNLSHAVPEREGAKRSQKRVSPLNRLGELTLNAWHELLTFNAFVGELILSFGRLLSGRASFRWIDLLRFLQSAGPEALPIVTLIGVLVGAVLAFVGAVQLQMFGAEIYVANLVGLGSVREMGAMMTAIIMAGRTGSAYAAQLGTMQVNDEIDALKTFGISVMDFLVLPRTLALVLMLPLLTIWADVLGIIGGMLVGVLVLDITLLEYLIQTQESMDLGDVAVGLVKSLIFAVVIAMSGCLRGLQSGKNSSAVGNATTSATVTAILLIVIWDAITTILFNQLGI
ncbi:MAG: ABC transporter permease [Candidatus Thiodiazotropha sp. (ex Semelilucina semeliformis)]|nr:ABC transporter permease [Candidatus Thiodiazotropha sp. (ex Myrtea spinifera)]MCU7807449.1 ABC transporter permease [Candidatus Thiodiazotropha sp. (ex Semelilucina semeliformis)]MCU7829273.1 ABC transporter permease [Candidatus Thiodiazotropha sp. (ex Myrtea sp. 'scaly one' KF741663)]